MSPHSNSSQLSVKTCYEKCPPRGERNLQYNMSHFQQTECFFFNKKKLCSGMCRQIFIFIKYILVYIHGYKGQLKCKTKVIFFFFFYSSSLFFFCFLCVRTVIVCCLNMGDLPSTLSLPWGHLDNVLYIFILVWLKGVLGVPLSMSQMPRDKTKISPWTLTSIFFFQFDLFGGFYCLSNNKMVPKGKSP